MNDLGLTAVSVGDTRPACQQCGSYICRCTSPPPISTLQTGVGYYATTPSGLQVWVPLYGWDGRG